MTNFTGDPEDWQLVHTLFVGEPDKTPIGWINLSNAIGNRLSKSQIRRRAIEEKWVRANGVVAGEGNAPGLERAREVATARRINLAAMLLDKAEDLLEEMDQDGVVRREVKVVPSGGGASEVQIVEVVQPGHDPSAKRNLAVAAAIVIDKAQLLSGEATSRHEDMTPEERRARIRQLRDEVADRRAKREANGGATT